jgi:hypothetical protein
MGGGRLALEEGQARADGAGSGAGGDTIGEEWRPAGARRSEMGVAGWMNGTLGSKGSRLYTSFAMVPRISAGL